MSREFYQAIENMHRANAETFANGGDGVKRHVECRITDAIYVYLFEDGVHIQTQHVEIPDAWQDNFPTDATVKRYIHRFATIGGVRITSLDS